ncbi:MAG: glycosyltransferase family 39 protein [Patescibacteria group bacterium]|nr:glycosyltransferase family 39 protein [Patescibacteria group bacterium]
MESASLKILDRRLSVFNRKFSLEKILLLLILLTAAFLRVYRIADYMEFLGDQGRDVVIVVRFLKQGDLMFIGPQTSIGNMYLGPWYYYLIAPALLLANFSPVGPALTVALIGVATVWLVWLVAKQLFGITTALLSALLFAVSPVVVYYSNFSWNPNVMPFFALLSVWLTWLIWQKNEFKKIPFLAFSLAMALNSHYLGLLLFPPAVFFLFLTWVKNRKTKQNNAFSRPLIVGILVFLLLMSPLLIFDLKHQFVNFESVLAFFTVRQTTVNLKAYKGVLLLPKIANQLFSNLFLREDFWAPFYWSLPVFFLGILKAKKNKSLWFFLVWFLTGLLGLSNYKQHIYAHYFGFLWPVAVILIAFLLTKLFWLFSLPLAGYLIYLALTSWHGWRPANFQLKRAETVAQFIIDQSSGEEFALALIAEMNYDPPYRYFIDLKKGALIDLHQKMAGQLFVICEPWGKVDCNPVGHPQWQIAAFGWAKIDWEWQVEGIRLFRLIHNPEGKSS